MKYETFHPHSKSAKAITISRIEYGNTESPFTLIPHLMRNLCFYFFVIFVDILFALIT